MLIFYRTPDCPGCSQIQDTLKEMCLAHKVELIHNKYDKTSKLPEGTTLPVLMDDDELFEGTEAIEHHLEELEEFKALWDKFQSDACYCNEKGEVE